MADTACVLGFAKERKGVGGREARRLGGYGRLGYWETLGVFICVCVWCSRESCVTASQRSTSGPAAPVSARPCRRSSRCTCRRVDGQVETWPVDAACSHRGVAKATYANAHIRPRRSRRTNGRLHSKLDEFATQRLWRFGRIAIEQLPPTVLNTLLLD